jgi:hypothetical protein
VSATVLTSDDTEYHPFDLSPATSSFCPQKDSHEMTIADSHDIILDDSMLLSAEFQPADLDHSQASFSVSLQGSPLVLTPVSLLVLSICSSILIPFCRYCVYQWVEDLSHRFPLTSTCRTIETLNPSCRSL